MIKENQAEFKKSNLNIWHNAEYKGQGITIVVLDDRGIPAKHLNVETPFLEEHRDNKKNHNTQVCSVARESAPLSRIISMPWFGGVKKEIIDWIFEHKDEIDIINCSFAGIIGKDEFNRLKQLDIPIICASGNNAREDKISRPARYDWTIAIGAVTESNGNIAGYSNGGKELDAVAYTAIFIPSYSYGYDKVFAFNGTSCASPYVCGILACYLSWRKEKGLPRLNKEEIRQFIHDNSIDMYEEGHDYKSGYGLFTLPKEIPEVENNPSPSPVPETPIIEESSIDLKDIMPESDYNKYISFRNIYENATKDGNEVASKYAKDSMIELLNQYKLDSEDYIDDEVAPRPKPEEPTPDPPTENPIIGLPTATIEQMQEWARGKKANQLLIDLAPIFYDISVSVGVNPIVTYCQSAKETGYMNFGGVLDASYNNPCGMKNSSGGGDYDPNAHKRFANWEEGIQAQVDHLALYSGVEGYPKANTPDPRHFPYLHGTATTVESLGGKWAPSTEYGDSIVRMVKEVENTIVDTIEPEPTPEPDPIEKGIELIDINIKLHGMDLVTRGIYNDGINYIPVRFLEQLGYDVEWNNKTIEINYKK